MKPNENIVENLKFMPVIKQIAIINHSKQMFLVFKYTYIHLETTTKSK